MQYQWLVGVKVVTMNACDASVCVCVWCAQSLCVGGAGLLTAAAVSQSVHRPVTVNRVGTGSPPYGLSQWRPSYLITHPHATLPPLLPLASRASTHDEPACRHHRRRIAAR